MSTAVEEIEKDKTSEAKKDELLLDSLEIKGYRCFEHLTIEKLGRVNLIVGKNNVGKTALLEAVEILCTNLIDSDELLARRNEIRHESTSNLTKLSKAGFNELIFQKEGKPIVKKDYFQIGKKKALNYFRPELIHTGESSDVNFIQMENEPFESHPFESVTVLLLSSSGMSDKLLVRFWDAIILTYKEEEVTKALQLISPSVDRVAFVNYPDNHEKRIPVIKTKNSESPVSIGRFGEGMTRLLGIALALVNCKNGILLIDEIEIGLHYSVLPDVWRLIFKTARALNVQVFAATHSYDCIEAFAKAAIDDEESDGMLLRLENKDGKIRAVSFNEDELETVERRNIEVR